MANILLIDDREDVLDILKLILEIDGHNVQAFIEASQGLKFIDNYKPDLVLTDLNMPEMSGYDVLKNIRTNFGAKIKVVAVTAEDESAQDQILGAGFNGYVSKPFRSKELTDKVRSFLSLKAE